MATPSEGSQDGDGKDTHRLLFEQLAGRVRTFDESLEICDSSIEMYEWPSSTRFDDREISQSFEGSMDWVDVKPSLDTSTTFLLGPARKVSGFVGFTLFDD
eukprot:GHVP01062466.1.p2 GENE.GHVP01062466.1~~GHVP01062466.1.p2  ORF type:complete len:101 (-),score=22.60 GHVP01062466.1:734-1036(-)